MLDDHPRRITVRSGIGRPGRRCRRFASSLELKICVISVGRASLELEREGIIITQQGKGSPVAEHPLLGTDAVGRSLSRLLEEVVRLASPLGLTAVDGAARRQDVFLSLSAPGLAKAVAVTGIAVLLS